MGKRKIILTHNSKVSNFDKMLKQVFPSSIPKQYVDKLIITTNDGNISEILGEQLEGAIPLDPNHSSPLSHIWNKETKTVEIYLNLRKVEEIVVNKVDEIFKNANLK
jgi:hypothetical protein